MAPYAVAIEKEFTFRGQAERFSNVWHYDTVAGIGDGQNLANAVVAKERAGFPTSVLFKTVRVWGPTDQGPAASETVYVGDLTGTGNGSFSGGQVYKELAVVLQYYLGRSPTSGRKRFLRKYIHCAQMRVTTGTIVGNDALSTTEKDAWKAWYETMKSVSDGLNDNEICAPNGDKLPIGTPAEVLGYLHVRQLKQ